MQLLIAVNLLTTNLQVRVVAGAAPALRFELPLLARRLGTREMESQ